MNTPDNANIPPIPPVKNTPGRKSGTLTRKQKAFVDTLMSDKSMTQAQAYKQVYNVKPDATKGSIDVQAYQTIKKPSVQTYLSKFNNLAENTIVNTINDWGGEQNTRKRELALNASYYLHDKVHGKSIARIQSESKIVTISVNLTGDGELPPENL